MKIPPEISCPCVVYFASVVRVSWHNRHITDGRQVHVAAAVSRNPAVGIGKAVAAELLVGDHDPLLVGSYQIDHNAVVLVRGSCRCGALRLVALHLKPKCWSCVSAVVPGLLCARGLCWLAALVACSGPAGGASVVSTTVYDEAENDSNTSMTVHNRQRSSFVQLGAWPLPPYICHARPSRSHINSRL